MTDIEHRDYLCPDHGLVRDVIGMGRDRKPLHADCGQECEVIEYVRADLHRGAVAAVDALLVSLDALNIEAEENHMAEYDEAREAVERWLTTAGGR